MSENATQEETPARPKHALRRNLLGRPQDDREPVKALVARYKGDR
jgi:hypothetical protein